MKIDHVIPVLAATADLQYAEAVAALEDALALLRPRRDAANRRRDRDLAIAELACLLGPGLSISRLAAQIASRAARFHPMLIEAAPERRALAKLRAADTTPPSARTVRRILAKSTVRQKKP